MKPQTFCRLCLGLSLSASSPVFAQIVPDNTLADPSRVQVDGNTILLDGGTSAETNLFHSFESFSVPAGFRAVFENSPEVRSIFSRITGNLPSEIDGTISANGTANLFLLNPNGIVFGANAQIDIGGSFFASTAESIDFADGTSFHTNASPNTILSVSVPIGLGLGSQPGSIVNRSRVSDATGNPVGLAVDAGQTLALVGGDITLDSGHLSTPQGRVELVALENGTWNLETADVASTALRSIDLTNGSIVDVSGNGGGEIRVRGNLQLSGTSRMLADTQGSADGQGIDIAANTLQVLDDSLISASTFGSGRSGNLRVSARTVTLDGAGDLQAILTRLFALDTIENPAQVGNGLYAMTFGDGDAGSVELEADTLTLRQGAFISTATRGEGRGGMLDVRIAETLYLSGSQIVAETVGNGDAGEVNLEARNIVLDEGGGIFASTFRGGDGGIVNLRASDTIDISGTTPNGLFNSGLGANAFQNANTQGGVVNVQARRIILRDGAGVGAVTFGAARGGTLILRASELVELSGSVITVNGPVATNIATRSASSGAAGDIEITTARLVLRDGAEIATSTSNSGAAGRLTIRASESVEISGTNANGELPSGFRSNATLVAIPSPVPPSAAADVIGAAGDITIVTDELAVRDGGQIVVSSIGEGERAGNLAIDAPRLILDDGARLVSETTTAREGNIDIRSRDIRLFDGSSISTNAQDAATGGNIVIDTDTLVAIDNSDITANAQTGFGGRVIIDARGVFGTEFRDRTTPGSDITASSDLGAAFSGLVEITNPDVQLDTSLVELASDFVAVDRLVADSCLTRPHGSGQFTVTGTGGLPENPYNTSTGRYNVVNIAPLNGDTASTTTSPTPPETTWQIGDPIVEARELAATTDGRIVLSATGETAPSSRESICEDDRMRR
ncbi:MAG: filamentous hemagglutinin N-terminal domain-containing protein [Cyanobacteria bacterium SBC]|nr:filamentous hemagglutinin N-terminal domain-containing protein [Cyanobacteria bacterium SBC]